MMDMSTAESKDIRCKVKLEILTKENEKLKKEKDDLEEILSDFKKENKYLVHKLKIAQEISVLQDKEHKKLNTELVDKDVKICKLIKELDGVE